MRRLFLLYLREPNSIFEIQCIDKYVFGLLLMFFNLVSMNEFSCNSHDLV